MLVVFGSEQGLADWLRVGKGISMPHLKRFKDWYSDSLQSLLNPSAEMCGFGGSLLSLFVRSL